MFKHLDDRELISMLNSHIDMMLKAERLQDPPTKANVCLVIEALINEIVVTFESRHPVNMCQLDHGVHSQMKRKYEDANLSFMFCGSDGICGSVPLDDDEETQMNPDEDDLQI